MNDSDLVINFKHFGGLFNYRVKEAGVGLRVSEVKMGKR